MSFSNKILKWFDRHGRKDLPWQKNISPYSVWVSEIMLQQTQVTTVIPYFEKFMKKFPTLAKLAHAKLDEVLSVWSGLGYYSRCRNLHRTAEIIEHELQGQFPSDLESLQELPGIGRSTAGAILAIAIGKRAAILDGNVKRVLMRFYAIQDWKEQSSVQLQLWQLAEQHTPLSRFADYTQAIMDLGATVCTRSKPLCSSCPLKNECLALAQNCQDQLPRSKPKKDKPIRQAEWLILSVGKDKKILLEKRPNHGIWGGLWCLPEKHKIHDDYQIQEILPTFRHTFTHFHLEIKTIIATMPAKPSYVMANNQFFWYKISDALAMGIPSPVKKILERIA